LSSGNDVEELGLRRWIIWFWESLLLAGDEVVFEERK